MNFSSFFVKINLIFFRFFASSCIRNVILFSSWLKIDKEHFWTNNLLLSKNTTEQNVESRLKFTTEIWFTWQSVVYFLFKQNNAKTRKQFGVWRGFPYVWLMPTASSIGCDANLNISSASDFLFASLTLNKSNPYVMKFMTKYVSIFYSFSQTKKCVIWLTSEIPIVWTISLYRAAHSYSHNPSEFVKIIKTKKKHFSSVFVF